ncbi:alpha-2-macroglobulin isoform X2 [Bombina bombina]|uniref:alpha-2-macroglobulin isoform X2 n=1 Tax=Bombina bombina TaxID=8345 RepID=UPI00235B29C3|nr:alpha-2-macroglobulin isoform X2 [Bombina bombina]
MSSLICALCLFLAALPGGLLTDPDPQYMLLVPTVLHGGGEGRLCLQLSHLNESVSVTVILDQQQHNYTLLDKKVTETEENNCVTFQVPKTDNTEVGFITLAAEGDTLHFKSRRSVLIKTLQNLLFIQTDKPIYKPGQPVLFRIVSLDENFYPTPEKFSVVYIEDPEQNRLSQWLDVETARGITQESFALTSEPRLGVYKVVAVTTKGQRVEHTFSVDEYVLPKYEVVVTMPPIITILDEQLKVTVCGKYTYGKPVSGTIHLRVCRKFTQSYSSCPGEEDAVCEEITHHTDARGCSSDVVDTKLFQIKRTGYDMNIVTYAKITEEGTDVEMTGQGSSQITSTISKVSFRHVDSHYKRGIPLYGEIFLEDAAGHPISNETVRIFVGYDGTNYTVTTGLDGTADFSIDTRSFHQSSIQLRTNYKTVQYCHRQRWLTPSYQEDSRSVNHFYSQSKSFVKVQPIFRELQCHIVEKINVQYVLTPKGVRETKNAVFHYLVMAKGGIVESGKHIVQLVPNSEASGEFTFNLNIATNIAPLAKALVYLVLDSGEVIADSVNFKVEMCFGNQVKLTFASTESLPGSQATLSLQTDPVSLCAVRAVDQSVLLLKPEAELSAKSVYNLLPLQELSGYIHEGQFLEEARDDDCLQVEPIFMNGIYYTPSTPDGDIDTYTILKNMGLKVITNTKIRIPRLCAEIPQYHVQAAGVNVARLASPMMSYAEIPNTPRVYIETVRKYFPETWIWQLVETDSLGIAQVPVKLPDSITTWKVGMFCTSKESGFGLSETVSHVAFQPFFIDLTLPYSAVRGETFTLKATVFNYLSNTIRVHISLDNSDQFLVHSVDRVENYCVGENNKVTVSWEITLKSLGSVTFTVSAETLSGEGLCGNELINLQQGRKDTLSKDILVEPEGIEKEETQNVMVCGKDAEVTELISLKVPDNVVEGSARADFSVIGDVMGTALQNLGKLLQMPFGCGEQNMVLFTPNIYILEYLNKTGQLSAQTKSKALSYLSSGYQGQLRYKHKDGSYSAFGGYYEEGNTWLTAFVMKSFARARPYIFIEEKQISDALLWLSLRQKDNGCFRSVGQLFHIAMKGGVNDEITLAAYITIALLEYPLPITHPVVRNALFCLEMAVEGQHGVYTKALMAYAFTLAGRMEKRSQLLQSLNDLAIKDDTTVHWHRPEFSDDSKPRRFFHGRAASIDIEMTSYVLLAILSGPNVLSEDMNMATKIVTWVVKQQNANGGFSSTQDTVVALQALSVFGSLSLSHDGPRTVTLSSDDSPIAHLTVEDSNRLLLQHVHLPKVPAEYKAKISGPGCLYLQTSLRYNVPHPKGDAAFSISVVTEPETCDQKSQKLFTIAVNVSYVGEREKSNMAVMDIKLPSGYVPVKNSVRQLTYTGFVKRTDTTNNKVLLYFDSLSKEVVSFKFSVEQDIPVGNLQPATAVVYDYYETDEVGITKYSAPCGSKVSAAQ